MKILFLVSLLLCLVGCEEISPAETVPATPLPVEGVEKVEIFVPTLSTQLSPSDGEIYFRGLVSSYYSGYASPAYLTLAQKTEADAQRDYLDFLGKEVDTLLVRLWAEEPTDETREKAEILVKTLFQLTQFQIDASEVAENNDILLTTTVSPLQVLSFLDDDYLVQFFHRFSQDVDFTSLDDADYTAFDNSFVCALLDQIVADLQTKTIPYGNPQSVVVKLEYYPTGYEMSASDWQNFQRQMIS